MFKKILLSVSVLLFGLSCFAKTPVTPTNLNKTVERQLDSLTKNLEKKMFKENKTLLSQERCGEGLHTHSQAKNHKGECYWPSEHPEKSPASTSRLIYDSKTKTYTYISSTGKVWKWNEKLQTTTEHQTEVASLRTESKSRTKYPPYW